MGATSANKLSRESEYELEEDDHYYETRPHSSVRRYNQPPQRDTLDDVNILKGAPSHPRRSQVKPFPVSGKLPQTDASSFSQGWQNVKRFPVIAVIVGMLLMAALFVTLNAFGAWWQVHQDDVTYGRPRTYQVDTVVGHNDSAANPTHFMFINLNRHVVIIELPGGDTTHSRIYNGPTLFGDGQDLTPITAEFKDVNGDGKIDIIVHIQDQRMVFINDGTQFVPQQPGQQIHL